MIRRACELAIVGSFVGVCAACALVGAARLALHRRCERVALMFHERGGW